MYLGGRENLFKIVAPGCLDLELDGKVETPPLGFLEVHAAFTPLPMSVAGSRQCDRQTSLRLLACYRGANITSFYAMTVTANTFEIVSLLLDCADQIFLREAASRAQWASAC